MLVYTYYDNGRYQGTLDLAQGSSVPDLCTSFPPPEYSEGQIPQWRGNRWVIRSEADLPIPQPFIRNEYIPIRMTKIDFSRLFRNEQLARIQSWRNYILSLNPSNVDLPENETLRNVAALLTKLDQLTEYIELNHPDTILGVVAFGMIGIYGPDPVYAGQETNRILAGIAP